MWHHLTPCNKGSGGGRGGGFNRIAPLQTVTGRERVTFLHWKETLHWHERKAILALIVEITTLDSNLCGLEQSAEYHNPVSQRCEKLSALHSEPNGQLEWTWKGMMPNRNTFSVVAIFNYVQYLLTYFPLLGCVQCSQSQGWHIWILRTYIPHFQVRQKKVGFWPWNKG